MKYYHSNEWDEVLSIDRVREIFEELKSEGYLTDESFEYYLEGCMEWNNGDLTPLPQYIGELKYRLRKVLSWMRSDMGYREDLEEEAETLTAQIVELEKYKGD